MPQPSTPGTPVAPTAQTNAAPQGQVSAAAPALASIAMFIAPLVAAVALLTTTGTIGRVQRDQPKCFAGAIVLVLVAGALWSLVPALEIGDAKAKCRLKISSALFAFAGFALTFVLTISIANDQPRPRITAALSENRKLLDATITVSGLPTDQRAAIHVDALRRDPADQAEFEYTERVYRAFVGPDSDGNVTHALNIPLPRGDFTDVGIKGFTSGTSTLCDDYQLAQLEGGEKTTGSGTACVTIALVPSDEARGASSR